MAGEPISKRRLIFAERSAQINIVLWFLIHLLVYTVLALTVILLPSAMRLVTEGFTLEEQYAASREFMFIDARVVPILLLVPLIGALHFVFITHRTFGPLVRLKRVLREWRELGVWPRPDLHVRRHDFNAELFDEFSRSTTALGEDVAAARELVRRAGERARALAPTSGAGKPLEGTQAIAEDCRLALERLERWQR